MPIPVPELLEIKGFWETRGTTPRVTVSAAFD